MRIRDVILIALVIGLAESAAAQSTTVVIDRADCQNLVYHQPSADVSYQPGKDVYGRDVAPADLNGGQQLPIPEEIWIPIEVDLFDRYNIPQNEANFATDAQIGTVIVKNGRGYFNGQPLQDEEQAKLAEKCQRILRGSAN